MSEAYKDIIKVMRKAADKRIERLPMVAELGKVIESSGDIKIQIDFVKFAISHNDHDFIIAQGLTLFTGDRVVLLPLQGGQNYIVIAKI